ncbi:MAG: carboxy terminal-processing peptidase [Flavobacteriaceae bacterium]
MKKNKYFFGAIVLAIGLLLSFTTKNTNDDKERVLIGVLGWILENGHYSPVAVDDDFSKHVYTKFIEEMDPSKRYFSQEDINHFSLYELIIDDQFKNQDLSFFNFVYQRFLDKKQATVAIYQDLLSQPFDYSKQETIDTDYEKEEFSSNENELIDHWRKQLKLTTLSRLYDKIEVENEKAEEDSTYVKRSFEELEKESRETTLRNMNELYERLEEMRRSDWLGLYVNVIVEEFDPHSSYFAPEVKERFDISMSGSLEGIGARLTKDKEYTKVAELISGGPAWKQGDLEVGDLITNVAQGDEESIDIVGMRLDDAIKFIKGKKGTTVNLTVKKIDGSVEIISIVRDVVKIEETFLKTSLVEMNNKKLGVINLPKFYIDFSDEKNVSDSGEDMRKALEELEASNVDGLLIDLRNNGGGSLKTAIDIAGMFINSGPVVQVKYRGDQPKVYKDKDGKIIWDKPLVILMNELSASASEIFAAAMQDYNRAIIMGSKQSFGKGTVQNVVPLNEYYKFPEDLGALKMTIQKFYRINGGSTQLEGVHSDIAMPDRYAYMDLGERDFENPLPYDKIPAATYSEVDSYRNKEQVIEQSQVRIMSDENFQLMDKFAKWTEENSKNSSYSLSLEGFKQEALAHEESIKQFDSVYNFKSDLKFYSPESELPLIAQDSILGKKREIWHKNLSEDMYISEALKVLSALEMNNTQAIKN